MPIENIDRELKKIYELNTAKKFVLPNFQRSFVWKSKAQKELIASFIVHLPIGSLLVLEGQQGDFSARALCFPDKIQPAEDCNYVLDGQQRLSTLRTVFYDLFQENDDWLATWNKLYSSLRARWFIRVKPDKSELDPFGFRRLHFETLVKYDQGQLVDFIEERKIFKTKTNFFCHPGYKPVDNDGNKLTGNKARLHIARKFAESNIVPLYELHKGQSGIHHKTLDQIASKRLDDLKAEVNDTVDYIVKYNALLGEVEDDIEELVKNDDTNAIDQAWIELKVRWVRSVSEYLEGITSRKIPIILLPSSEISRAVAIFEAINKGGTPLSVYDLVVAKAAKNSEIDNLSNRICKKLRDKIDIPDHLNSKFTSSSLSNRWSCENMQVIDNNEPARFVQDWYLNILSLIVYLKEKDSSANTSDSIYRVEYIKRERILELSSEEINQYTDRAVASLVRAFAFVHFRCGVMKVNSVPYRLMVLVIAYFLDDENNWNDKIIIDQLEHWYWCSLFGGGYHYRQNETCIEDVENLSIFFEKGENKFQKRAADVLNIVGYANKDMLLRKNEEVEGASVREGILQYILSKSPVDFLNDDQKITTWGVTDGKLDVEVHHLIPLADATTIDSSSSKIRKDKSHILNSALNLTYISKNANRKIRDKVLVDYFDYIDSMSTIGHCVPSVDKLKNDYGEDYYESFLTDRFEFISRELRQELDELIN